MRKMPGIEDADDVAGVAVLDEGALLGEELHRVGEADVALQADVEHLHPALEAAGADAEEGDAVAVRAVHVRLDLEDEAAEAIVVGRDGPAVAHAAARAGA